ncbi:MAG: hypothetical protein ACREMX_09055 [Gemmatimonadales bacterium]
MAAKRLAILTLAIVVGCGGQSGESAVADSLSRDLQRLPVDSSAALNDRAGATGVAAQPKPAARKPSAPVSRTLVAGTTVATRIEGEISSRTHKAGQTFATIVSADVKDGKGRVVIPAGSRVTVSIAELRESENKGDKTGKLSLTPTAVEIGGRSYPLEASATALDRTLRDRKTNAGDVAKVGAGTAAGAVVGRVVGGNTKGAVIGGLIGGAIGTQRAVETQDRDVVVPAGSRVELILQGTFTR